MRGINKVQFSGNIGHSIKFNTTDNGYKACSFQLASDRYAKDKIITVWAKVNVYRKDLVNVCESKLKEGAYVIVTGELMNRNKDSVQLLEVRALELVFV